jgi:anti-sigma regulatory factor (Ser/Thr protein kinase)
MPAERFTLPADPSAIGAARRRVLSAVRGWGHAIGPDTEGDLALVVSELTTNAVLHAQTSGGDGDTFSVEVALARGALTVSVWDADPRPPCAPACPADDAEDGRGLALVAAVTRRHGWERTAEGKRCWAELRAEATVAAVRAPANPGPAPRPATSTTPATPTR